MVKMKSTKSVLITSICALFLCVSMLIGSTFAWFTDSVTSAGNKIRSGSLQVDLELLDKDGNWNSIKDSRTPLFNYDKWEPGYMDVKVLKIENAGTLALKWYAKFVSNNEISALADVIDVYVCSSTTDAIAYPADRNLEGYTKKGTLRQFLNTIETTTYGSLEGGKSAYLGIALKMQETAGNEYQNLTIGAFDIQILATQKTFEGDSFNNQYDEDATYPLVATEIKTDAVPMMLSVDGFDVLVPASAPAGTYSMSVTNVVRSESEDQTSLAFSLIIEQNGSMVASVEETLFAVSVDVGAFQNILSVENIGNSNASVSGISYDNQAVTFNTTGSGIFEVVYAGVGENIRVSEEGKLIGGEFKGVNPVAFDASLAEADSAYIAINYTKDGETCYVIAERATTTIIAADAAADYVAVNGNYEITKNQSGKLYSVISGLQNQEFSTVYILPGTYNEATTIGVYSSMDIIGLGDRDAVKIIKQSSSSSNRHLFNCSGTKADYIHVTLRNLYLDATTNTTNNKDNAAVQSIRKTKVKCYDLTIVKNPTNMAAIAFYVNGNNAVDGVKYPAYLYAENCSLNTTKTFCIVSTAGTYKFYHTGLTYNGTVYTQNSGSILNKTMEPDCWDW